MNRYGKLAYDHTRQHRPKAFAAMDDPTAYFTALGEEVESRIHELWDQLLGSRHPGEEVEHYRRRGQQARQQAEEIALAELVWIEPEAAMESEDDQTLAYRSRLAAVSKALAAVERSWTDVPAEASPSEPPRP